jgi:pimeloyl-ACP methyl ester carboxylesterase
MLQGTGAALAGLGLLGATGVSNLTDQQVNEKENIMTAQQANNKPAVVLVHGAWADGTSWQGVIPKLEQAGYIVTAVQNPLTSLADDVASTKRVIDAQVGPVIVVGHSYGGAVIGGAADGNPNVKALVYIAAFALDVGEPGFALLAQYPTELGGALVPDAAGFLYIDRAKFHDIFCQDVDPNTARVMAAAQKPVFNEIFGQTLDKAAWKTIPSWYLVATEDKALSPDMERFLANRMNATTVEVKSSHVTYISKPNEVVKLIEAAAKATM